MGAGLFVQVVVARKGPSLLEQKKTLGPRKLKIIGLAFVVFEVFDLLEPLLGCPFGFVRPAQILTLLGNNFVAAAYFLDHEMTSDARRNHADKNGGACGQKSFLRHRTAYEIRSSTEPA
jgi:hypothetical protein